MNSSRVSAVVLAAGMSTRMGRLKQLALFRGKPLLQIVLDGLKQTLVDEIIVILGHQADQIKGELAFGSACVVLNDNYAEGMSTSIKAGISHVDPNADGALIIMVDQPLLKPSTIDQIVDGFTRERSTITIPVYRGYRGNPVLVDRTVFPEMKKLTGDSGLRSVFANYSAKTLEVAVDDPGILIDTDTADELDGAGKIDLVNATDPALLSLIDVRGRKV